MRILNKYLLKEVFSSSIAVFGVLMIILSSNTMLRLIEEASIGNFPTYLLIPVILIKVTQYSIHIIPISLFFGIIISLGKFYNNNEMAVISSSGQSPLDIVKILSNIIHSQMQDHLPYGGVVPELAARQHLLYIKNVIHQLN